MAVYTGLNRAQLSYEYLHTNSTTHEFLFGALAELVDNSRDANASKLDIFTVTDRTLRGGYMLCFQDDGEGMDPSETANVITFGRSIKKGMDSTLIGQYGNGLKSGSMRIANDVILFTKKETSMTCLMLSRTFHEEEKIQEVIVPLPSFQVQNHTPILEGGRKGKERHDMEMDLILKYSPFHTRDEFFNQFRRITGDSGTLVIVYNLKLLDSGATELDFKTDPNDILLTGTDLASDRRLVPERHSFRAYLAILYLEPRMKVFIQNKKVQALRYIFNLYKPRCYQYTSARFKARSKEEAKRAEVEMKSAVMKLRDAEGKSRELEKMFIASPTNKDGRVKLRAVQKLVEERKEEVKLKTAISERKQKALKEPKTLTFNFGLNLENRKCDGLFIYNCNRLIKMYERIGPQLEGNMLYRGIVVIINVPYIVLEPTHNKQDFADAKEYRHLLKVLGEHMEQYCRDLGRDFQNSSNFWEEFGYTAKSDSPSNDFKYANRRARQIKFCIQCDTCLKWRVLPYSSENVGKKFPDDWVCSWNPDPERNRCSAAEEKLVIPEGKFQKAEKCPVVKKDATSKDARQLISKLQRLTQTEVVLSSASARKTMERVAKKKKRQKLKRKSARSSNRNSSEFEELNEEEEETEETVEEDGVVDDEEQEQEEVEGPVEELRAIEAEVSRCTSTRRSSESGRLKSPAQSRHQSPPAQPAVIQSAQSIPSSSQKSKTPPPKSSKRAFADPTPQQSPIDKRPKVEEPVEENFSLSEISDENGEEPEPKTYTLDDRVEVYTKGKWRVGTVTKVYNSDQVKVKFDDRPENKYDKVVSMNSEWLKHLIVESNQSTTQDSLQHEVPSSSTCTVSQQNTEQILDEVARGYRTCLHYFLPPQWIMDKDVVNSLTPQGLITFPLDDFFDNYEKGLRKLVSGFQQEATASRQEAERAQARLTRTNQLIARLLNSIHDECNLDPEQDSNKVDELLQACVLQAEKASTQTDQVSTSCN